MRGGGDGGRASADGGAGQQHGFVLGFGAVVEAVDEVAVDVDEAGRRLDRSGRVGGVGGGVLYDSGRHHPAFLSAGGARSLRPEP